VGPLPIASRAWFKRSQRILGRDWPTAYLFVGLTVVLLGTIKAYPFLRALWYSFHNVIAFRVGAFVGLDNYVALWGDERFTRAVGVTLTFTAVSVAVKRRCCCTTCRAGAPSSAGCCWCRTSSRRSSGRSPGG
jgi:hypothetical protein